jgi:hypothetical protein
MKVRTLLIAGLFTVGSLGAVASLVHPSTVDAQGISARRTRPVKLSLQCRNYGGQQDVSKNPDIINSSKQTIPSGKTLYWQSTDGDNGSVVLDHTLVPGGKVGVNGKPGQSYTCTAWAVL